MSWGMVHGMGSVASPPCMVLNTEEWNWHNVLDNVGSIVLFLCDSRASSQACIWVLVAAI